MPENRPLAGHTSTCQPPLLRQHVWAQSPAAGAGFGPPARIKKVDNVEISEGNTAGRNRGSGSRGAA